MSRPSRRLLNPVVFVCDIQERFRPAIHAFPSVIATTQKVLQASKFMDIPVVATTQLREKLGPMCSELGLDTEHKTLVNTDKSKFSMWIPEVQAAVSNFSSPIHAAIVGIESHVCVTQTVLDLLDAGHHVSVLADGVSSCNAQEVPIALARLRTAGATITTSESWLYEVLGDAVDPAFADLVNLVKKDKTRTKTALQSLL